MLSGLFQPSHHYDSVNRPVSPTTALQNVFAIAQILSAAMQRQGRTGLGTAWVATIVVIVVLIPHGASGQEMRARPARLVAPNDIGSAALYDGSQLTTIRGGECIAIKLPAGQLTLNKVIMSAVSMSFTNISSLVSACPLNPAGKMTNLMVAVLRSDQVPPGVPLPNVMRKRRPEPADAALVAAMSQKCRMTAGEQFEDVLDAGDPSAAPLRQNVRYTPASGAVVDKYGTYYQMSPSQCDALRERALMAPWSAARQNFTFKCDLCGSRRRW